ncbi:DUF1294 domain-containing protein [Halobacillus sp. A5]|uniref:DUF1294 domain-containing protein n=1 Tax=Halobacillus sp. A5 TaxID=2880263 RepID=UPI0020A6A1B0|nr:DUF1294 domain-containing protein [Halobacillus sp. A5]MCP3025481.1 DUF1294 domain-containing protein [Halobacillus sp. A5]
MELTLVIFSYLGILNVSLFIVMGYDKSQAVKRNRRISEKTIWMLACAGGALGGFAGMEIFRHKTKHTSFKVGMPLLVFVQAGFILWVLLF